MLCEALIILHLFPGPSQGQKLSLPRRLLNPQDEIFLWKTEKLIKEKLEDYYLPYSDYEYQELKKIRNKRKTNKSEHLKGEFKEKYPNKSERLNIKSKTKQNKSHFKKRRKNSINKSNKNNKNSDTQSSKSHKTRLKHNNRKHKDKQKKTKKKKGRNLEDSKQSKINGKGKKINNIKNRNKGSKNKVKINKKKKNNKIKLSNLQSENYKQDLQLIGMNLTTNFTTQEKMEMKIRQQSCPSSFTDECGRLRGTCMDISVCVAKYGIYYDFCNEGTTCICCTADGCIGKENSACRNLRGSCRSKCFENETEALSGKDGCGTGDGCRCCKSLCNPPCKNSQGTCLNDGKCQCEQGFSGNDCSRAGGSRLNNSGYN